MFQSTDPLGPLNLNVNDVEVTSVLVLWDDDQARSYITMWEFYYADQGSILKRGLVNLERSYTSKPVTGLTPGKNYTAYVNGISGAKKSKTPSSIDFTLGEYLFDHIFSYAPLPFALNCHFFTLLLYIDEGLVNVVVSLLKVLIPC